jgi:hypothetical protein
MSFLAVGMGRSHEGETLRETIFPSSDIKASRRWLMTSTETRYTLTLKTMLGSLIVLTAPVLAAAVSIPKRANDGAGSSPYSLRTVGARNTLVSLYAACQLLTMLTDPGMESMAGEKRAARLILARRPSLPGREEQADCQLCRRGASVGRCQD